MITSANEISWGNYKKTHNYLGSKELFLRKISFQFFDFIKDTKIKAEHITTARIVLSLILPMFIILGSYLQMLMVLILLQLVLWTDYIDGLIARYKNNFKQNWVYLDTITHYIISALLLFDLGLANYLKGYGVTYIILGSLSAIFLLFNRLIKVDYEKRYEKDNAAKIKSEKFRKFSLFYDFTSLEQPFGFLFFFLIFNLFKITTWFYFLFTFFTLIRTIKKFVIT